MKIYAVRTLQKEKDSILRDNE